MTAGAAQARGDQGLADPLPIDPLGGPFDVAITPPGSKSLTTRAVVLAAMARGESRLNGVLQSIDTRVMLDALRAIGCGVEELPGAQVRIPGLGAKAPRSPVNVSRSSFRHWGCA